MFGMSDVRISDILKRLALKYHNYLLVLIIEIIEHKRKSKVNVLQFFYKMVQNYYTESVR